MALEAHHKCVQSSSSSDEDIGDDLDNQERQGFVSANAGQTSDEEDLEFIKALETHYQCFLSSDSDEGSFVSTKKKKSKSLYPKKKKKSSFRPKNIPKESIQGFCTLSQCVAFKNLINELIQKLLMKLQMNYQIDQHNTNKTFDADTLWRIFHKQGVRREQTLSPLGS